MATSRSASRAAANARTEVLDMLKQDHKRAKKAFRDFEKLDPKRDAEACRELVEQTCAELTVHADLEEELFYPAVRGVIKQEDLLEEAEVEHMSAKALIEQLQGMQGEAGSARYAATFTVLGEYIKHHIKEEEGEMFEKLARARLDWEGLLSEMSSRREELMAEHLPQDAMDEASDASASAAGCDSNQLQQIRCAVNVLEAIRDVLQSHAGVALEAPPRRQSYAIVAHTNLERRISGGDGDVDAAS